MSASNLPAGPNDFCAHGVSLMRFCDACEESNIRAEQHFREQQQVAADRRIVEYHQAMYGPSSEDSWADEPETPRFPDPAICETCGYPLTNHPRSGCAFTDGYKP